jgi:hypothetical protein
MRENIPPWVRRPILPLYPSFAEWNVSDLNRQYDVLSLQPGELESCVLEDCLDDSHLFVLISTRAFTWMMICMYKVQFTYSHCFLGKGLGNILSLQQIITVEVLFWTILKY